MSSNQKKNIRIVKKRKVNKKKLAFVIIIFLLIVFLLLSIIFRLLGLFSPKTEKNQVSNVASANENTEQFNLEDEKKSKISKSYTVFIDAGHGGYDGGSSTPDGKFLEKDINLKISKKIASFLLKQDDVQVILSRTDDKFIDLTNRVDMANKQSADVFVSIHLNSFPNIKEASGVETYYRKDTTYNSEELATSIQETIVSYVPTRDRGVKTAELAVLSNLKMPSVLVEAGFLSNDDERKKLLDESYQSELAQGIAQGILTFLDEYLSE